MKTQIKFSFISMGLLLSSAFALAGPALASSCPTATKIVTPTGAGNFFMSKDCQTVYLLPPEAGKVKVTGFSLLKTLHACNEVSAYQLALQKVDDQINRALDHLHPNDGELQNLFISRKQVQEGYGNGRVANQEALDINLFFDLNAASFVQKYRDWNSTLGLNFRPVNIKNVQLFWTGQEPSPSDLQPVISNSVAANANGLIGEGTFNVLTRLPLVTMCSLTDPFTGEMPDKIDYPKISGAIAASVTYEYDVQATYTFNASYELSELASEIKRLSSSGGFFTTSSMSDLISSQNSSGWFKLEVTCDDSRVCEQVKLDKALQIKSDLVKQVLDEMILFKGGNFQRGGAAEPGQDGAATAADGLRKCPNEYCQAGAIVLDVANSIFGGSNKADSYIETHHGWRALSVSESIPVSFKGNIGFIGQ